MDNFIDEGFFDITQTWDQTIGGSTCVIVKNRQDREWLESVNPLWYQSLKGAGVDSIVLFPLIYNENTLGYMWALNFNEESTVKIKETLELTTFFITSEIANYQLLQRLERLEQQADKANISLSVGTYVVHEGEDIRNAMRAADERMYNDKKEYYDKHPEKRYR